MLSKIKIIIVDDHPLFRMGVKSLLLSNSKVDVIAEAENGKEALDLLEQYHPDIILLDIDMPKMTGDQVAEYIKTKELDIKIIFLTSHSNLQTFNHALKLHVRGFLFKESALEELNECIDTVYSNNKYISPSCQEFLDKNNEELNKISNFQDKIKSLTPTELKILKYIANHYTTKSIAETLHNSYKTIENHRFNICQKLEIKGTNNLLSFALDNKEFIDSFANS